MNVGIIGGTGYGGIELIRLLHHHPHVKLKAIVSHSFAGEEISKIYPHLKGTLKGTLDPFEDDLFVRNGVDIVFSATPAGVSKDILPRLVEAGIRCIDLSGDFRLRSEAVYEQWYDRAAAPLHEIQKAVYGLPELNKSAIQSASLIANPGCYPTATVLGLLPAIHKRWIDFQSIVIDGKSGVSGAGRQVSLNTLFAETNENIKAYKVGKHQHIPEIEQVVSQKSGTKALVSFTTHLIPMTRGLMCTMSAPLTDDITTTEIIETYESYYEDCPFVRIRSEGEMPSTKEVTGSNFCDIGLYSDERTGRLTVVSVIDNLVKGAAGQAIQNMNLMNGWDETLGLQLVPVYP